jgi:hypothetical protein
MRTRIRVSILCTAIGPLLAGADPALTIYNQNFAVVREALPLDLKAGNNNVRFMGTTMQVEPESVILRDPGGRHTVQVIEQNYRNDAVSQERLLKLRDQAPQSQEGGCDYPHSRASIPLDELGRSARNPTRIARWTARPSSTR